jgi:Lamin Tail Domain/Bacterial Ig-like domain
MRKFPVIALFLFANVCLAQFTDNFSDGDFAFSPIWSGMTAKFTISTGQLRLQAPAVGDIAYLSTPSQAIENASWEFSVKLDFNPSSGNYTRVYLVSDQQDLTGPLNGYYVLVGDTPDEISLYRQTGTTRTKIIDGPDGRVNLSVVNVKVKATRNATGNWSLFSDVGLTGNYISEGTVSDTQHTVSRYAGVFCLFTATRSNHFYFDNFIVSGTAVQDTTPPVLLAVAVNSSTQLLLTFSEEMEAAYAQSATNYLAASGLGSPATAALLPDQKSVLLTFTTPFPNGVLVQLTVSNVRDLGLNPIATSEIFFRYFEPQPAGYNDLVINELFPDPSPQIGLPSGEFIEIYNRSAKPFDLTGWTLRDLTSTAALPSVFILPGEYLILTSASAAVDYALWGSTLGLSGFPTLNNSSDAFTLSDPSGLKIDSVNYNLNWYQDEDKEQGGFTLERLNPEVFTNDSTNWQASEDALGGTPGKPNSVLGKNPDSKPPQLLSLKVLGTQLLQLVFNEPMDISALAVQKYEINNGIGNPNTVTFLSSDTVLLQFENEFVNGIQNALTISGVADLAGNGLSITTSFLYFIPSPVAKGVILFNEIMADPAPVVQLPEAEFIELVNVSAKPFDLIGWKLIDATDTALLPSYILMPGSFVILSATSNVAKLSTYGKTLGVTGFPSLNNTGERLALVSRDSIVVDSVAYELPWHQDNAKQEGGWSLERLLYDFDSNNETNWRSSEDETGGTPGKQNSVFGENPDRLPPELLSLEIVDAKTLVLAFHEEVTKESAESTSNFVVNENIGMPVSSALSTDGLTITLAFASSFTNGMNYEITVSQILDLARNEIQKTSKTFLYFIPTPVEYKDIVFTEIMADPSPVVQLPETEYIEILNRSLHAVDMQNWTLTDGSTSVRFPHKIILPGDYWVLTSPSQTSKFHSSTIVVGLPNFPSLNNNGESLRLQNAEGITIDSVNFTLAWYREGEKTDGGWSLELIDPGNSCGEEDNWSASEAEQGGTPGEINSINASKPDLTAPKLLSVVPASANEVHLAFNEKLDPLIDGNSFHFSPPVEIEEIRFIDNSLRYMVLHLKEALQNRVLYQLEVQSISDCAGNTIDPSTNQVNFALPEKAETGDLVLNEVLFNPQPNGVDFVEIYNASAKFVDLKGWGLSNIENNQPLRAEIISATIIVAPHAYVVFTSDKTSLQNYFPLTPIDRVVEVALPSLPDDAGSIAVVSSENSVIDYFLYEDDFHSPLLKDEEGVSLERISFNEPTNHSNNWISANSSVGYATPGQANSASKPYEAVESGQVAVTPEIISPGSLGTFAQIKYQFEQNGFIANVKIIDQQGRPIKEVANNESVGYEGFFRWDGDQYDGTPARSGYYVVWFEVFDLQGKVKTYRKRVVVANK